MKKRSTKLKWVGLTLAGLGAAMSSNAMAHMVAESRGGLKVFDPQCCDYWFSVGGRVDIDETVISGSAEDKRGFHLGSGANIRRAYLKFMGGVGEDWSYNLTLNFSSTSNNFGENFLDTSGNSFGRGFVSFEDAWINYSGLWDCTDIRVGQFTPLTTIDDWGNWGTTNDNMFLESALDTVAFSRPQKALGIWLDGAFCDMFTVGLTAYQPEQNPYSVASTMPTNNNYQDPGRGDKWGGAARLTFVPVHEECLVYHLGVLGRFQSMNNMRNGVPVFQNGLFNTRPEAVARNTSSLVNTGSTVLRARSYNVFAAEALGIWGPASLEAEYHTADVQRVPVITSRTETPGNVRFNGWHVQGGYVLTGEARRYDFRTGTIHNPRPATECGAWEIVARYSYVNLSDKNVYGGSEHNTSVGLNWFVNDNVKIALNYVHADVHATDATVPGTTGPVTPVERDLDIVGLRFHWMF